MVPASQRSDLKISCLQLSQKFSVFFIQRKLFHRLIQCIAGHYRLMMGKAHGDIAKNISYDSLNQISAARHGFFQNRYRNAGLYISHTAADIHADRIGDHHIFCGYYASNGHSLSCVGVRHQTDPAVEERKFRQMMCLFQAGGLQILFAFQPYFDGIRSRFTFDRKHVFSPFLLLMTLL